MDDNAYGGEESMADDERDSGQESDSEGETHKRLKKEDSDMVNGLLVDDKSSDGGASSSSSSCCATGPVASTSGGMSIPKCGNRLRSTSLTSASTSFTSGVG